MIDDNSTNLAALYKVLFEDEKLELSEECVQKVEESFNFLQSFSNDKIIYGINTGFGPMAQYRIEDQSLLDLQYNIIRSHSTGAGKPLPKLYVKAAMIALARKVGCTQGISVTSLRVYQPRDLSFHPRTRKRRCQR